MVVLCMHAFYVMFRMRGGVTGGAEKLKITLCCVCSTDFGCSVHPIVVPHALSLKSPFNSIFLLLPLNRAATSKLPSQRRAKKRLFTATSGRSH